MTLHLRQVAIVARDLGTVVADLRHVFDLDVCFVDAEVSEFGLENSLLAIGTNFIEVVAPIAPGSAAERYLDRRDGDGGYMIITQAANEKDQRRYRRRAKDLGIRVAWEKDHPCGRYLQLHPRDIGGAFFEIDYAKGNDPLGDWPPAGGDAWRASRRSQFVRAIRAVELQSPHPLQLAQRWAEVADLELTRDAGGLLGMSLENADIRFVEAVDNRGEGLGAIDIEINKREAVLAAAAERGLPTTPSQVVVGGVRFNLI